jgi:hypothetical protein
MGKWIACELYPILKRRARIYRDFLYSQKIINGQSKSGKLTPRSGTMGRTPGKRQMRTYAIVKCPMNMEIPSIRLFVNFQHQYIRSH